MTTNSSVYKTFYYTNNRVDKYLRLAYVTGGVVLDQFLEKTILLNDLDTDTLTLTVLTIAGLVPIGVFCDRLQEVKGQLVEKFCNDLREWERLYMEQQ